MKPQQTKHQESGCTDYLQHNTESCPHMNTPAQAPQPSHSPLPFKSFEDETGVDIMDCDGNHVARIQNTDHANPRANAEYFIRACNEHQNLKSAAHHMEACRSLVDVPNDDVLYQSIKDLKAHAQRLADALKHYHEMMPSPESTEALAQWENAQDE